MSSLYRLLRRRPSLVAASLLVAGCGSNPAGPSTSPPVVVQPPIVITPETNLPAGSYRLTLLSSPSAGDCTRELPSVPLAGAIVEIDVRLTHTEGGSVVRSATAADGELELQVRRPSSGSQRRRLVAWRRPGRPEQGDSAERGTSSHHRHRFGHRSAGDHRRPRRAHDSDRGRHARRNGDLPQHPGRRDLVSVGAVELATAGDLLISTQACSPAAH